MARFQNYDYPLNRQNFPHSTMKEDEERIRKYCTYQERSSREVRQKMSEIGIRGAEAEKLLESLIDEQYVNDERFTECFIRGKMNTKRWGRMKLQSELFKKGITASLIQQGLSEIDEEQYAQNMEHLIEKWHRSHSAGDRQPLFRFLLSKGYESERIDKITKRPHTLS